MTDNGMFSISEFARYSRTTRDTLLHYDRIGLLSPISRGENNYRYYSVNMLPVVNVIRTLQQLGMTLGEIKRLRNRRTPELADEVFRYQIGKIDKKIEEWIQARKLLLTLQKTIHSVAHIEESVITIRFMPAEAIVLGDINDFSRGRTVLDALVDFYHASSGKYPSMDLNYPVWATYSGERIKNGDWKNPERYYFYNPEGYDRKPASLYAIGYTRGGYGQTDELYTRLTEYINKNGFEICGDAYEEYPLNEVCVTNNENYLIRVMVAVKEK